MVQTRVDFHNLFDCTEVYLHKLNFSDIDRVIEWIDIALLDLSAARKLYKSENGLALYHLQQGIEKLLKATLMFTGFKTESNVITLNHKPQTFLIELLNDPDITQTVYEKFPYKGVKRPVKPSAEQITAIQALVNLQDKILAVDKGDEMVRGVTTFLGRAHPLFFDPQAFGELNEDALERIIPEGELKKFKAEFKQDGMTYEDTVYNFSNYCFIVLNMSLILLPLHIGMWGFESIPRYPDEYRRMTRKFSDYESYKSFYTIINQVETFGECFKKYMMPNETTEAKS